MAAAWGHAALPNVANVEVLPVANTSVANWGIGNSELGIGRIAGDGGAMRSSRPTARGGILGHEGRGTQVRGRLP